MNRVKLTVYFEDPFWVGLFERESEAVYSVERKVYGAEPTDREIYVSMMNYRPEYASIIETEKPAEKTVSVKRLQKLATKELSSKGPSKKAWDAMKLQQEERKTESVHDCAEKRRKDAERKFSIRQDKKREKHKGR